MIDHQRLAVWADTVRVPAVTSGADDTVNAVRNRFASGAATGAVPQLGHGSPLIVMGVDANATRTATAVNVMAGKTKA
jgi:hypothetical protein